MICTKCKKDYILTPEFNPFSSPDSIVQEQVCYKCNKYNKKDLIEQRLISFSSELKQQFEFSKYICLSKSKRCCYRVIVPHRLIPKALDEISYTIAVALKYKYKAPYGIKLKESPDEFIDKLNNLFNIKLHDKGMY